VVFGLCVSFETGLVSSVKFPLERNLPVHASLKVTVMERFRMQVHPHATSTGRVDDTLDGPPRVSHQHGEVVPCLSILGSQFQDGSQRRFEHIMR